MSLESISMCIYFRYFPLCILLIADHYAHTLYYVRTVGVPRAPAVGGRFGPARGHARTFLIVILTGCGVVRFLFLFLSIIYNLCNTWSYTAIVIVVAIVVHL
jgi:hypothetical protein